MRIEIEQGVYLTSDAHNYIVLKRRKNPTPKNEFEYLGYFQSFEGVMQFLLNYKIKKSKADTLLDLLDEVKEYTSEIKKVFKGITWQ